MGKNTWTKDELEYLEENWGSVSITHIAKKLDRSLNAIRLKAQRIGLSRHIHSGDFMTFNELCTALNKSYSYTLIQWMNKGCPVKTRASVNQKYRVIKLDEFWKWAEKNRTLINFAKFEEGALGTEPNWAKEQRKSDAKNKAFRGRKWTETEDAMLMSMLKQYRYSYTDVSKALNRTIGAIKRRICDLNLKERPLKAENHRKWTTEEIKTLTELYNKGMLSETMVDYLDNRSASAINGKIERMIKSNELISLRHQKCS